MAVDLVYARAVSSLSALSGTLELAPWLYGQQPTGTRELGHDTYSIGILSTSLQNPLHRQKAGKQVDFKSEVGVMVMGRIRPDNASADYQTALSRVETVYAQLIDDADGTENSQGQQDWRFESVTHQLAADGTHLASDLRFTVWHNVTTI